MSKNFNDETQLKYWVQKVLPLVYDDSLSYYELLGKVVAKLNTLIENNSKIPDYILELIRNYIDNKDIDAMIEGTIRNYLLNVKYPPNGLPKAIGDGKTDDTIAIQNCIDYAHDNGYGVVYFPYGNYLVNGLTLYDNVSIKGFDRYSTTLTLNSGATKSIINAICDNVGIYDIGFNGNGGIQLNTVSDILLKGKNYELSNLLFKDSYTSIQTDTNGHLQIDNIDILSAIDKALVLNSDNVELTNCMVERISASKGTLAVELNGNNGKYSFESIADVPTFIEVNGNSNYINLRCINQSELFVDNGENNIINDNYTNTTNSDFNVVGNLDIKDKFSVSTENTEIKNTLKYGNVLTDARFFDGIEIKDNTDARQELLLYNESKFKKLYKTVDDYGAVGDGVTDDYDAIMSMFNETNTIVLGPKVYFVSKRLELNGNVSIIGLGEKTSILYWNNATSGSGIKVTLDATTRGYYSTCCTIENLSICNDANATGSTAIEVEGRNSIGDRFLLKPIIRNVHISSYKTNPFAHGWGTGIYLHNCNGSTIYSCCIVGLENADQSLRGASTGIYIHGDSDVTSNTEFMLNNLKISLCGTAIKGDFLEGIMLQNSVIIGCLYGIYWVEKRQTDHLCVTGCHINCEVRCILTEYVAQFDIQGNLFYLNDNSSTGGNYIIELRENSYMGTICSNTFQFIGSAKNGGALAIGSMAVTVLGNVFNMPNQTCVWLRNTSSNCIVRDNCFLSGTPRILNAGRNNKVPDQGFSISLGESIATRGTFYAFSDGVNIYLMGSLYANLEKTMGATLINVELNGLLIEPRTNIAIPTKDQVCTVNIDQYCNITIGNKALTGGDWCNFSLAIPIKWD